MHELSLAQSMIEQLMDVMEKEGEQFQKIEHISLELGSMSGVDRDAFEFVFPFAAEGTPAEGAILSFNEVTVQVRCRLCDKVTSPEYPFVACNECGATDTEIICGKEFKITQMEVS
ncbi:MAG: hydrogenase maturation nickel metallochaperone HypA [Deltaproteobacteria bacterium]|nr:hydrogenase maturation nickel metallochaperone HypA [Deltaproteobacteria bacterium]MBN2670485.1 hydrogenase maturation nickel metallochaperone HypA [Deltaproteobacteria bacterium]